MSALPWEESSGVNHQEPLGAHTVIVLLIPSDKL